ncbi:MAG: C10 family peptidase [Alloprevotella sp.]|nr:C10 family peptidase [Alloprevotella sp.]
MAKSIREISKSEAVDMALSHSIHRFGENVAASRSAAGLGLSFISSPILCGENETNTFLSMNWGWGGDSNGWYRYANPSPYDFSVDRQDMYVHP